jgi:hypothetical protein
MARQIITYKKIAFSVDVRDDKLPEKKTDITF